MHTYFTSVLLSVPTCVTRVLQKFSSNSYSSSHHMQVTYERNWLQILYEAATAHCNTLRLLGCDTVSHSGQLPTLWTITVPPPSGFSSPTNQHYMPKDLNYLLLYILKVTVFVLTWAMDVAALHALTSSEHVRVPQKLHAVTLHTYPTFCETRISLLHVQIHHIQEWGIWISRRGCVNKRRREFNVVITTKVLGR